MIFCQFATSLVKNRTLHWDTMAYEKIRSIYCYLDIYKIMNTESFLNGNIQHLLASRRS